MTTEDDIRRKLHEMPLPESDRAEERAWQAVRAAYEDQRIEKAEDPPRRRSGAGRRPARRFGLAVIALLGAAVLVISPAGAEVRDWVSEAVKSDPRPAEMLTSPPGGGTLLVDDERGSWVVSPDGSRRRLGEFADPTWSPRGLFIAAVNGNQLVALEPDGDVRWTLARPAPPSLPSWNSPDGYRIAYIEGNGLRVVAGDGSGDHQLAGGVASVRPAWRPGPGHLVAFALPGGRVRVTGADGPAAPVFTVGAGSEVKGLEWSRDGSRLLIWTGRGVRMVDPAGRTVWSHRPPGHSTIGSAAIAPDPPLRVAITEKGQNSVIAVAGPGLPRIDLFSSPGRSEDPIWSPDGSRLAIAWPAADQWIFLQTGGGPRIRTFTGISEQFDPGGTGPAGFPRITGWCCS